MTVMSRTSEVYKMFCVKSFEWNQGKTESKIKGAK